MPNAGAVYDCGYGIGGFLVQAYEHIAGPNHANIISPDNFETLKMTRLPLRWAQDVAQAS